MKKRMIIMLILVGILFGGVFGWKIFTGIMVKRFMAKQENIVTVSTKRVETSTWQSHLNSVGSIRAVLGVNVTTELAGMVQTVYFDPGAIVKEGQLLVQLNADAEIGQLQSLQAQTELAKITYERDKAQYAVQAVSKQTVDTDKWTVKNLEGQTGQQAATVKKKSIRAPFTGRTGISNVYPGQYLNTGDKVTSLQTLDPVYIDFFLPQQALAVLRVGQTVTVVADAYPKQKFMGKISTIEPAVDSNTRNVQVEATLANPNYQLAPGMFAAVNVTINTPQRFLTLPQTAITFNPYGEIAYIVTQGKDNKDKPIYTVKQTFVTTGDTRGDQIQVLKGLKEGDIVVTSGQLKLRNGSQVTINNQIQPTNDPAPQLMNK